jgi:hypothetical protein
MYTLYDHGDALRVIESTDRFHCALHRLPKDGKKSLALEGVLSGLYYQIYMFLSRKS